MLIEAGRNMGIEEAARRLGVHRLTIKNMERRGKIKFSRDRNGWRIFDEQVVEELQRILHPELYADSKSSESGQRKKRF